MAHRFVRQTSSWLAFTVALGITGSALVPAANAQTFQQAPPSTLGAAQTLAPGELSIYPRAATEVVIGGGVKVNPLKTVRTQAGQDAVADRLIVRFAKGVSAADQLAAHELAARRGGMTARAVKDLGAATRLVDVSGARSLEGAVDAYRGDARVVLAAPDLLIRSFETPNDTNYGQQANMNTIQAPAAWNRSHGDLAQRIAILDTGIDLSGTHPDLTNRVAASRDFTGSVFGATDKDGHGTHVAGIAGAITNNTTGVAGVAWNASLLNAKVLDDTGSGSLSMLTEGIRWSVANGADVINMSLGSTTGQNCNPSAWEDLFDTGRNELRDAIEEARSAGVVLVAAAGNNGNSAPIWPADCPNVLSVASTTTTDTLSGFSNFGTWVDVAAPGSGIFSTALPLGATCASGNAYFASCSGTSMAAPHVAGLAALVKSSCNFSSPSVIETRLRTSADAISGTGTLWQAGRINALRAVCFPAPTNLQVGATTTSSIQVLWTNGTAPADTATEVHLRPHNGATWTIQQLSANQSSFVHQGLTPGAGYDYKVRDCDPNGCSAFSNQVTGYAGTVGHTLSINTIGTGRVTSQPAGIDCGADCSDVFASGTNVTLHAQDGSVNGQEWVFMGWTGGGCSGRGNTCTVAVNAATNVSARFVRTSE